MKIQFNDIKRQFDEIKNDLFLQLEKTFEKCDFILGESVCNFEKEFAKYIGCDFGIGVSNGTDAIKIAAKALYPTTEEVSIFIPNNTFIATAIGIKEAFPKGEIILVDCDKYFQIDVNQLRKIIKFRKFERNLIVPVHLYGFTANMKEISKIALENFSLILEDASQAHGAKSNDVTVGSLSDAAAFSLYPGKNLGAAGDAGIITTDSEKVAERCRLLRNYGSKIKHIYEMVGTNNRLDTIQAGLLSLKLKKLNKWNDERRRVASIYNNINNSKIKIPKSPPYCEPVYHIYPVLVSLRDDFVEYLKRNNIPSMIHYPQTIFELNLFDVSYDNIQNSINYSKQLVSLPMHPFLSNKEGDYIVSIINKY